MKPRWLLFLTTGLLLTVADYLPAVPNLPPEVVDKAFLQGTWTLVSIEMKGNAWDCSPFKITVDFTGDKCIVSNSNDATYEKKAASFKLDASRNPKQIDIVNCDDTQLCRSIYLLDGDVLKVCGPIDNNNSELPKKFATDSDGKYWLAVLKRTKP